MSEQLTRIEVDCATGEQKVIPLTPAEIAELDQLRAEAEARRAAEEEAAAAKEAARQSGIAKLLALGLTQEEAEALVK